MSGDCIWYHLIHVCSWFILRFLHQFSRINSEQVVGSVARGWSSAISVGIWPESLHLDWHQPAWKQIQPGFDQNSGWFWGVTPVTFWHLKPTPLWLAIFSAFKFNCADVTGEMHQLWDKQTTSVERPGRLKRNHVDILRKSGCYTKRTFWFSPHAPEKFISISCIATWISILDHSLIAW